MTISRGLGEEERIREGGEGREGRGREEGRYFRCRLLRYWFFITYQALTELENGRWTARLFFLLLFWGEGVLATYPIYPSQKKLDDLGYLIFDIYGRGRRRGTIIATSNP